MFTFSLWFERKKKAKLDLDYHLPNARFFFPPCIFSSICTEFLFVFIQSRHVLQVDVSSANTAGRLY